MSYAIGIAKTKILQALSKDPQRRDGIFIICCPEHAMEVFLKACREPEVEFALRSRGLHPILRVEIPQSDEEVGAIRTIGIALAIACEALAQHSPNLNAAQWKEQLVYRAAALMVRMSPEELEQFCQKYFPQ
jgi:hypothetical protein